MRRSFAAVAALLLVGASQNPDPIADTIAQLKTRARPDDQPLIARAEDALQKGYRMLALQRLAVVVPVVEGTTYAAANAKADLDSEWKRNAKIRTLAAPRDLHPAAVRALAEVASLEARCYYDASLDYAKATSPAEGFFYIGRALGQKTFIDLAKRVSQNEPLAPPPIRSIASELDALNRELLVAYKPPASIDRHSDFIGASAMVKEARELDQAGLRYGALIRYLEAARRVALITMTPGPAAVPQLPAGVDHSIGQVYVEAAKADPANANILANFVIPRYLAALQPAAAARANTAKHTITLVRWPYT
jgi:hypothetical protein